jgi:hypothetical protein
MVCQFMPHPFAAAATENASPDGAPALKPKDSTEDAGPARPAPAPVEPEKLNEWITQLDDDHFAVRESAQQQLIAAGSQAVKAVGEAAAMGSLESTTRAVNILLGWSQSKDADLGLPALEQLAALKNRPTESAMAAQRLADVRETAALKAIVDLGGRVDIDRQSAVFNGNAPPIQVVIGPQWKGGVEGLHHVQNVRRASTLSFHSTNIAEQAVPQLRQFSQLHRIEFYGVEVAPETLGKLKDQLPNVAVEVRSGARLGIAGSHNIMLGAPNPKGALVSQVLPDSAAAKAGIQQGDVIAKIADADVKDFEHLTQEIAKCQPGQSVALKVLRQGVPGQPPQNVDITVTFDRWGDEAPTTDPVTLGLPGAPDPLGMAPRNGVRQINVNNRR